MIKHKKYKNTGLIFEVLVYHTAKALLDEDITRYKKIRTLVETHFSDQTSHLFKELLAYRVLMEKTIEDKALGHAYLQDTLDELVDSVNV